MKIEDFNKRVDKEADLQIRALSEWSDLKKLEFGFKIQQNQKNDKSEIEQLEKSGKEKEKLLRLQETSTLYIHYNASNEKLGKLIAEGKATQDEISKQQKEVQDFAKNIEDNWKQKSDIPAFGKNRKKQSSS